MKRKRIMLLPSSLSPSGNHPTTGKEGGSVRTTRDEISMRWIAVHRFWCSGVTGSQYITQIEMHIMPHGWKWLCGYDAGLLLHPESRPAWQELIAWKRKNHGNWSVSKLKKDFAKRRSGRRFPVKIASGQTGNPDGFSAPEIHVWRRIWNETVWTSRVLRGSFKQHCWKAVESWDHNRAAIHTALQAESYWLSSSVLHSLWRINFVQFGDSFRAAIVVL